MVWIYASDQKNCLTFSEGYIPDDGALRSMAQQLAPERPEIWSKEQRRDARAAWIITSVTHRMASRRGFDTDELGLETWLFAPTMDGGGALDPWFTGIPQRADYRVMIHRTAATYDGEEMWENIWATPYRSLHIRHRTGRYAHLKGSARDALTHLLQGCRGPPDRVQQHLSVLGHPYYRCRDCRPL